MVILVAEWLRKNGAPLEDVIAIDPIEPTPLIDEYFSLLRGKFGPPTTVTRATYLREYSTSSTVANLVDEVRPELVFVDGDHTLKGALADHLLARKHAKIIVHHDIESSVDTSFLWHALKSLECAEFEFVEFVDQYQSVEGNFLGIGVMKRRPFMAVSKRV